MQGQESLTEKRTRLARKLLENAEQEIAAGDLVQGSEMLWGATSQALKAYCASHGLPHGRYAQRRQAVFDLATRQNDPAVRLASFTAQAYHANFYNDWMEQEDLDSYLPDIQHLVETILKAKSE